MEIRTICVLGGAGFVGHQLLEELSRRHYRTRVLTRRPQRHRDLLVLPGCELVEGDALDDGALAAAIEGCEAVINLVGILNEIPGAQVTFERYHAELPGRVGRCCRERGVRRLLHMSALNAGPEGPSRYLESKGRGEEAAHAAAGDGLTVTSFRPSVIFGPGDGLFERFAALLAVSPVLPLACPRARLQPVYVGDVARAMSRALRDRRCAARRYDLVGPKVYTLRELVDYTAEICGRRRHVIELGDGASRLQARILGHLPGRPFTLDNYLSLQRDSVSEDNGLIELGIRPTSVEAVVPGYLGRRNRSGFYSVLRSTAGR